MSKRQLSGGAKFSERRRCGKFGEFAIPVADFDASAGFWTQVGFEQMFASQEPYPWGIFGDGHIVIGLHQQPEGEVDNHIHFTKPTMTYFAPDMAERITTLRAAGLSFAAELPDEQGRVANAALAAPGDQQIFLFEGNI